MGNKQGKQKTAGKEAKDTSRKTKENGTEDISSSQIQTNTESQDKSTNDATAQENDDIHPSWEDPVLYTHENKKVSKDDFELLTVIGKGSFGKVMQVKKKDDGKIYAMKVLRKEAIIQRKQMAHTKAEKSILSKIQHPFIVKLHYAFQTKDKLYMVLDFVNGGELFFHLKKEGRFPENRVKFYAAEIVSAMSHLHSLGIVYRDLKPENILLDHDGHITITDFGLSKEIDPQEGTHTFCGTPEYLAPEVLKGLGHGIGVDWWSLGTLIYEMLTGLPPFYSQNINIMYQKILNGELRFPTYVSPDARSLLEGLLTRDPEKRLGSGSEGGKNVKAHPFFKDIDWEKLDQKQIEPPWKPKVRSENDVSQIDTVFTTEKPQDSLVEGSALDVKDNNFDGFTFVGPTAMEGHGVAT